ncbi:hypothetical protein SARC_02255 [Sphaeroforma arctica JP610]|uniref:Uncharacterized protein n=1 Tax=Sphaeroforma arctica JP610 TaxID=667725 RepID=A0A0L0G9N0_9EUKA|nr:hypothetical protein SARC_02255 [Sphaeroforma arctica JP610]KNC85566.1 hypothetical protein SARC_02255 [Sphaeroforma arctica JP610]|eukprot:XP_014159468.1 hypothetical protein SARC_02255 [Sphaeroforma arctica JP610]
MTNVVLRHLQHELPLVLVTQMSHSDAPQQEVCLTPIVTVVQMTQVKCDSRYNGPAPIDGGLENKIKLTGMRAYLKKFTYSNASTGDLWAALSTSSGKDVKSLMTSWTRQAGYPVLTVSAASTEPENSGAAAVAATTTNNTTTTTTNNNNNNNNNMPPTSPSSTTSSITTIATQITVQQEQYLSMGAVPTVVDHQSLWQVPVNILIDGVQAGSDQLLEGSASGTFESSIPDGAVWKLNAEMAGFYRVRYDQALLPMLQRGISNKTFSVADRTGIVNDMFALASAGYTNTTDALQVLSAYTEEDDTTVWTEIIESLDWLSSV